MSVIPKQKLLYATANSGALERPRPTLGPPLAAVATQHQEQTATQMHQHSKEGEKEGGYVSHLFTSGLARHVIRMR